MEGGRRVLGGDYRCYLTSEAAGDKGTDAHLSRGNSRHGACPYSGAHGSRRGVDAVRMHPQDDRMGWGGGHRVGLFLHGRRNIGGGTVGGRRGAVPSAVAVAGVLSSPGHGGEDGVDGAPAVAHEGGGLPLLAGTARIQPGQGDNHDIPISTNELKEDWLAWRCTATAQETLVPTWRI